MITTILAAATAGAAPAENPYGSGPYGNRYQGQRGPTASRSFQNFHRTDVGVTDVGAVGG